MVQTKIFLEQPINWLVQILFAWLYKNIHEAIDYLCFTNKIFIWTSPSECLVDSTAIFISVSVASVIAVLWFESCGCWQEEKVFILWFSSLGTSVRTFSYSEIYNVKRTHFKYLTKDGIRMELLLSMRKLCAVSHLNGEFYRELTVITNFMYAFVRVENFHKPGNFTEPRWLAKLIGSNFTATLLYPEKRDVFQKTNFWFFNLFCCWAPRNSFICLVITSLNYIHGYFLLIVPAATGRSPSWSDELCNPAALLSAPCLPLFFISYYSVAGCLQTSQLCTGSGERQLSETKVWNTMWRYRGYCGNARSRVVLLTRRGDGQTDKGFRWHSRCIAAARASGTDRRHRGKSPAVGSREYW